MPKAVTTESFIQRANEIHNYKYNYSKTVYISAREKVTIICEFHGDFKQSPNHHLRGYGCRECGILKCADSRRHTLEEIIEMCEKVHGNRYDYSELNDHKNIEELVPIICNDHGIFLQSMSNHIYNKRGCPKCAHEETAEKQRKKNFIEEAQKIHGDKYSYEFVEYHNNHTKVILVCSHHGEFRITPQKHLYYKQGCKLCSYEKMSLKKTISNEEYIERVKKVHGNKYCYKSTIYTGLLHKIFIECPIHGIFEQLAKSHLKGYGCKNCTHKTEKMIFNWFKINMGYESCAQFSFDDCRNSLTNHKYRFDFRIGNILIELDGCHHFRENKYWKSDASEVRRKDIEKTVYLLQNGYSLIRVDQLYVWECTHDWDIKLENIVLDILESNSDTAEVYYIGDKYDNHIRDLEIEYFD